MASHTVFVALTWMVTTVLLCTQAAPVTEFFGPPQTIEGDSYVEYPNYDDQHKEQEKVEEMERFHRTYKNGTVEFKMALSNGHVQYQRISTKIVDGAKVPVYEGYTSEQYKDGRYGTRYYAADENGYRSSSVIIENDPPKLPTGGPYRSSLPENIQNELSPPSKDDTENEVSLPNEDDVQTKPKTLLDDLLQIEKDLEEQQLANLNLSSYNANENSLGKIEDKEVVSEKNNNEEPSILQNSNGFQTGLPINLDFPTSTEIVSTLSYENNNSKFSEESESSSNLPALGNADEAQSRTEQPINDTDLSIQSIEEELAGSSSRPSTSSETLAKGDDDVKISYEEPINLLNDVDLKTEKSIDEIQETTIRDLLTSIHQSEQLKFETWWNAITKAVERNSKNLTDSETLAENEEDVKVLNEEPINLVNDIDGNTEQPIDEIQEVTTGNLLNAQVTSTEQSDILNKETQAPNSDTVTNGEETIDLVDNVDVKTEQPIEETQETTTGVLLNSYVSSTEQSDILNNETQAPNSDTVTNGEEPIDLVDNVDVKTEQPIDETQETTTGVLLNSDVSSTEQSEILNNETQGANTEVGEESAGRSLNSLNNSEILAENDENVKVVNEESIDFVPNVEEVRTEQPIDGTPVVTTGTLLNNEVVSTEQSTTLINESQEQITGIGQIEEVKIDDETSSVSGYPLGDAESTTLPAIDNISNISTEEEITKIVTEQPTLEDVEDKTTETIASENKSNVDPSTSSLAPEIQSKGTETVEPSSGEVQNEEQAVIEDITSNLEARTEKSFDEVSEASTGTFLNDEVTVSEQPENYNSEALSSSTPIPELTEVKTDGVTSSVAKFPLEDTESGSKTDVSQNSAAEEILEDTSTETVTNDLPTSSFAPKIENKNTETIEVNTELPLEDSTSQEISNESQSSEKDGKGFDLLNVLPLSENKPTNIVEGSENKEDENTSEDASISSETNEETTNKIESNEEERTPTISSGENNNNEDATIEADAISTSEKNDLDLQTSSIVPEIDNTNTEISFEASTDLPQEDSTKTDDEDSQKNLNESEASKKEGRSFDFFKLFPFSLNNSTKNVEGNGNKEDVDASNSTETNDDTTNKIDISTEKPESTKKLSLATTISDEDNKTAVTTEGQIVVTTQTNEASSSEKSVSNKTEKDNGLTNEKTTTIFEDFLNMF